MNDSTTLVDRVRSRLASTATEITSAVVAEAVRAEAGGVVGDVDMLSALRLMRQEFVGAGPLDPLLRTEGVTDVLVTAPDQVWLDGDGGLRRTDVTFPDEDAVRRLGNLVVLHSHDASFVFRRWVTLPGHDPAGPIAGEASLCNTVAPPGVPGTDRTHQ